MSGEAETVYVGSKPILTYVLAVINAFQRANKVKVLARGRAISSAVDVVEVTRRSFLENLKVENIEIGTETVGEGDEARNVSTIAITLSKEK
ncbi:MAG: DNA-binding protein Alba [Candidatus Bathyarchaeota archaeon B23]|nr:MAG: DNA-binding protein Alba [Candidatus Bathyarchaeota archaeon B23]